MNDKEKLEKALVHLKKFIDGDCVCDSDILADFPELAESEDEKIRKQIVNIINHLGEGIIPIPENQKELLAYLEKQKGKGWSEEDEKNMATMFEILNIYQRFYDGGIIISIDDRREFLKRMTKLSNWLKSLRPKPKKASEEENLKIVQYCLEHIRLANWNEEDEEAMIDLCNFINSDFIQENIHETRRIPWSKALEKNKKNRIRFIPLRPSWKPSDEQMRGLKYFLDYHRPQRNAGTTAWKEFDFMDSLYTDLLKLKSL